MQIRTTWLARAAHTLHRAASRPPSDRPAGGTALRDNNHRRDDRRGLASQLAASGLVAVLGLGVFGAVSSGARAAESDAAPEPVVSIAPGVTQPDSFDRRDGRASRSGAERQAISDREAALRDTSTEIRHNRAAEALRSRDEQLGVDAGRIRTNAEELESTSVQTMPLTGYVVGARWGAVGSWARYHTGVDLQAPLGSTIVAPASGTVVHAGSGGEAGSWAGCYVVLEHRDGRHSLYAHMSCSMSVSVGQQVSAGTRLGQVGVTGRSFGPHLHLELYDPGVTPGDIYRSVDPMPWLATAR